MTNFNFAHVFHDEVLEPASGAQVMENLEQLKSAVEALENWLGGLVGAEAGAKPRIQAGVYNVPGFGGGSWSFDVPLLSAWPSAHLVFVAANAQQVGETNTIFELASGVKDLGHGHIQGPSGPNFVTAHVQWLSVGY